MDNAKVIIDWLDKQIEIYQEIMHNCYLYLPGGDEDTPEITSVSGVASYTQAIHISGLQHIARALNYEYVDYADRTNGGANVGDYTVEASIGYRGYKFFEIMSEKDWRINFVDTGLGGEINE